MILIGLKGNRLTGKSVLARHLVENEGFARMHPFDGGKAACMAFFQHMGIDAETAQRMVFSDLKDQPSPLLPRQDADRHHSPRFFLENFGRFMGVDLGPDWTLAVEVERLRRAGCEHVISESIAFEEDVFRELGGIVIEIRRQGSIRGILTGQIPDRFPPHHVFVNDFSQHEAAGEAFSIFLDDLGLLGREVKMETAPESYPEPM